MSLPPLAYTGAACTKCGFVGKGIPNMADAKKELAQLGALLFGGITAGALAYAATPHKQGDLCPDCQVPGTLVPITSTLAKPALEKAFGSGATIGDYLLATEGILPLVFKGSRRFFTLDQNGVTVGQRYSLTPRKSLLTLLHGELSDIALQRPRLFVRGSFALQLVPVIPKPISSLRRLFYFDYRELRFSKRAMRAATMFVDAFRAIHATVLTSSA